MCLTAQEVRELWKQENTNRATLAILPNTAEFKKMAEAASKHIAKLKG